MLLVDMKQLKVKIKEVMVKNIMVKLNNNSIKIKSTPILLLIIIFFFLLTSLTVLAEKESVLEMDFLIHQKLGANLDNLRVFYDEPDAGDIENENYLLLIYDKEGVVLHNESLPIYFYLFDSPTLPNEIPLTIKIPYHQNYNYLELQKNKTTFFFKDIGSLCQKNQHCQAPENHASCPQDCPSGSNDQFCDTLSDGRCDPDCLANDLDCTSKEENKVIYFLFVLIFILMVIVLFCKKFRRV